MTAQAPLKRRKRKTISKTTDIPLGVILLIFGIIWSLVIFVAGLVPKAITAALSLIRDIRNGGTQQIVEDVITLLLTALFIFIGYVCINEGAYLIRRRRKYLQRIKRDNQPSL